MESIFRLIFVDTGHAGSIATLVLVWAVGLALGNIKIAGIRLGVAGVLFAGLLAGHLRAAVDPHVLEFLREFGLMLFVYTVGLQVGAGIDQAVKAKGLLLNGLAAAIVLLGAAITAGLFIFAGVDRVAAVGIFSGATTNTPSLGAAQQALADLSYSNGSSAILGMGYAVCYPFGIIGTILSFLIIRTLFKVNPNEEAVRFEEERRQRHPKLITRSLIVENVNLQDRRLVEFPAIESLGVTVSRVYRNDVVTLATPELRIRVGDVISAVGTSAALKEFEIIVGRESKLDIIQVPAEFGSRDLVVTNKNVVGKSLAELGFRTIYLVNATRIRRADMELSADLEEEIQFGDVIRVVGAEDELKRVQHLLGNSVKKLNEPELLPMYIGIFVGIMAGLIPFSIPGVPVPVKLGLAGGPLLVGLILGRLGHFGPVVSYFPHSANLALREFGIVLFLSAVGIKSGGGFVETLTVGPGLTWMLYGVIVTLVPLLVVGVIAKRRFGVDYLLLSGVLAGSMTDPPALAFANQQAASNAPGIGYAAVYPLTMVLRMLAAQLLILIGS